MEIYLRLDDTNSVSNFISKLSEIDIFSDIYIFIEKTKYFELFFSFLEKIIDFLNTYNFSYLRLHPIHFYEKGLELFYSKIYTYLVPFNLEGYYHQNLPRLLVLPIFIEELPEETKNFLESLFFPCSVISIQPTCTGKEDPLISVGYQNILLNLLENIYSFKKDWQKCLPTMIFEKEKIFPCIYAYENGLTYIENEFCGVCLYNLIKNFYQLGLITSQDLVTLYFKLGLEFFEKNEIKVADKFFCEILNFASSEEKEELYYYLGICEAQLGNYDKAIKYLKETKAFNHNTLFYLGFSYFQKRDFLKAKKNLEKALTFKLPLEEKIPIVLYLAHTYKELEMNEEAINLCEKIAKEVSIKEVFNLMGICYFRLKAYDKAVNCFKKAILCDPFSAIDYANLCLSLKALNRKDEARYYGERALELDPGLDFVKKVLEEIAND